MLDRTPAALLLVLVCCATCLGQTPFMGLTPGKSTKRDAESVLGRPVKVVQELLIEYAPRQFELPRAGKSLNSGKIYVQYRDASAGAVVERIELILCARSTEINRECDVPAMHEAYDRIPDPSWLSGGTLDAFQKINNSGGSGYKFMWYFGSPRYMVRTDIHGTGSEVRWGFYSKELYEEIAPRGNCTGMIRGEWETNRGRMNITRVDEYGRVRGTYSNDNGTFTGKTSPGLGSISGEWKDDTGSGTMFLQLRLHGDKKFQGTWERTSGSGPAGGVWEGRCVETEGGGND
jgi:hypothetical protein